MFEHEDCSDRIAQIEVLLQELGLAKLQRAYRGGEPTEQRRWVVKDPDTLRRLMGEAVVEEGGLAELEAIKAGCRGHSNPFYLFRHWMSADALDCLARKLKKILEERSESQTCNP